MSQTKAQLVGGVGFSTADSLTVHNGLAVTGVITATSFSGSISGNSSTATFATTAGIATNAQHLSGTPGIAVGIITATSISAVSADFSGNVTIGGTLQYEDVTNIDAIGIVTARSGINITGAGMTVTGISTFRGDVQVADKIVHLDDPNTAIRFPAADTFTVETGGSERIRVDSNGNVLVAKTGTAITTAGSRLSSGFVSLSGDSTSTNLAANAGGALSLANVNSTDNNFSNIGGYNSNGLVVSQIDFINKSHSSRTGDIAFLTHNGSAMSEKMRITSGGGIHFNNGELLERINITAGKLSDNTNIDLEDGMAHLFTTTETTTATPNIRVNSSTTLNSVMAIGDVISVTIITTAAAAAYSAQLTIDGVAVTEKWNGGSAPSAGGSSGNDYYTYSIIKTADATYTVLANVANFA